MYMITQHPQALTNRLHASRRYKPTKVLKHLTQETSQHYVIRSKCFASYNFHLQLQVKVHYKTFIQNRFITIYM